MGLTRWLNGFASCILGNRKRARSAARRGFGRRGFGRRGFVATRTSSFLAVPLFGGDLSEITEMAEPLENRPLLSAVISLMSVDSGESATDFIIKNTSFDRSGAPHVVRSRRGSRLCFGIYSARRSESEGDQHSPYLNDRGSTRSPAVPFSVRRSRCFQTPSLLTS